MYRPKAVAPIAVAQQQHQQPAPPPPANGAISYLPSWAPVPPPGAQPMHMAGAFGAYYVPSTNSYYFAPLPLSSLKTKPPAMPPDDANANFRWVPRGESGTQLCGDGRVRAACSNDHLCPTTPARTPTVRARVAARSTGP